MKRPLVRAAALSALALAISASPAVALRDDAGPDPKGKVTWITEGGTPTAAGVSADGPKKSSNAYTMGPVSYVYPQGYWDMALGASSWKFSYTSADLTGAGQLRWSVAVAGGGHTANEDWVYLDPFYCRGDSSASGWETADFTRAGADCAIYVSWQSEPYVGTDAVTDELGNVVTPATSAWDALVADNPGATVYYGFAIVDSGPPITVDRVMAGGNLISKF
jgi:hypothetical protein